MAWKRGTQNNSAGEIRKGHIKEFLTPSSKATGVVGKLKILAMQGTQFYDDYGESYFSLVCSTQNGLPSQFSNFVQNDLIHLHAHQHPRCVISALVHPDVPEGCIVMNDIQCLNSKVCTGEREDFTVYAGDSFVYDGREGVIGDTEVRFVEGPVRRVKYLTTWVRPRFPDDLEEGSLDLNAKKFCSVVQKFLFGAIVSVDEVFQISMDGVPMVCRVAELEEAEDESSEGTYDEEVDFTMPDCHRGIVDSDTVRMSCVMSLWTERV